jgi:hypothetical protein
MNKALKYATGKKKLMEMPQRTFYHQKEPDHIAKALKDSKRQLFAKQTLYFHKDLLRKKIM